MYATHTMILYIFLASPLPPGLNSISTPSMKHFVLGNLETFVVPSGRGRLTRLGVWQDWAVDDPGG